MAIVKYFRTSKNITWSDERVALFKDELPTELYEMLVKMFSTVYNPNQ